MFASLQGRLTASNPPGPKADESRHCDGGARGGEIFPEVPLASQQPCRGLLGPEALPLVGGGPGCDSSDPSHVMEPRGPANHTATAMDPVHGLQSGFGQTDFTLTTQRGAVLRSGYGSEGTGEVSMGMGSTAFTGHQSQPGDAARQPFPVIDSAPSGVSALSGVSGVSALPGVSGLSALPGQSIHSATVHGDTPMEVEMGLAWPAPSAPRPCRTPGAFHFRVSLSCPGPSLLSRESGHPRNSPAPLWGPGNFQGRGKTPAIRQAPPLHFGGTRLLPNRTTATITSITAPAVTMASYGGVSTSTSLGRPISSLGIAQNNQVSGPSGQPQQQWSGSIPQGVQLPYTQGTNNIPMEQALNRVFPRGIQVAKSREKW